MHCKAFTMFSLSLRYLESLSRTALPALPTRDQAVTFCTDTKVSCQSEMCLNLTFMKRIDREHQEVILFHAMTVAYSVQLPLFPVVSCRCDLHP